MHLLVNTGGGDAPGLNAVLRAVTLSAVRRGLRVTGIRRGYAGLFEPEAEGLLRKFLGNGPLALRHTLEAVQAGLELPFEQAEELEAALFALLCSTEDMQEGTRAFLEKRAARFQGK